MAEFSLLVSTLLMGALAVAAALAVGALGRRRSHVGVERTAGRIQRVAESPLAWTVAFLALVAVGLGGVLLYVTGASVAPAVPQLGLWLVGVLAGVVVLYLLWGVYNSARYRGLHRPAAIATAAWMVGILVVAVISLRLLDLL